MDEQTRYEVREIEKHFDNHYKRLNIFKYSRAEVILNFLRFFEDSFRIALPNMYVYGKISVQEEVGYYTHNLVDALDISLKWIYKECKETIIPVDRRENAEIYKGSILLINEAMKYKSICTVFTHWSRNRLDLTFNKKRKELKFTSKSGSHDEIAHADDIRKLRIGNEVFDTSEYNVAYENMINEREKLVETIQIDEYGYVNYNIEDSVWHAYSKLSEVLISRTFQLPDEWVFDKFSLKEFKQLWYVLYTFALIHKDACFRCNKQGLGIESIVIIKSLKELVEDIASRVTLEKNKISDILSLITYNPSQYDTDASCQPIINLDNWNYAISPHLIISINIERNLTILINKINPKIYSRLSVQKEDIMISELKDFILSNFPHLICKAKINLPKPLPDMDLVIYDKKNATILIAELKWFIAVDSIKEMCKREEDLIKGISQAKKILDYSTSNLSELLLKVFQRTDIEVNKVYTCVISKNNIGSSELKRIVPVVDLESLKRLFVEENGNINTIISKITSYSYLPKNGTDYLIRYDYTQYAGYNIIGPVLELIDRSGMTNNKVGRNDFCPCGKINIRSGKPEKYKNCCGR